MTPVSDADGTTATDTGDYGLLRPQESWDDDEFDGDDVEAGYPPANRARGSLQLIDDQVGSVRAGRLLGYDLDSDDAGSDSWAWDVGVDAVGASAEEAAIHIACGKTGQPGAR